MRIVTVVGARPQFVKAAAVSRLLRKKASEYLVHTGQHYDDNMSEVFFRELGIPAPDASLGIGSASHGAQTGRMLEAVEVVLLREQPDAVLVYGDTNSTLAACLAASKLKLPIAHVEAGLRSFRLTIPEEVNRIVADHLSTLLLAPSETAVRNLEREGLAARSRYVGDVMADALASARELVAGSPGAPTGRRAGDYVLATIHRPSNTDDPHVLWSLLEALGSLDVDVIFPVHPRTRSALQRIGRRVPPRIELREPVGYLDMVQLELGARAIVTDSGGVQKEAYWVGVPCVTLRDETEWVETVALGWNTLVGTDAGRIVKALTSELRRPNERPPLYGEGVAAASAVEAILSVPERSRVHLR
jgi:UDP-GlcNAc3NAcA epimerase